MGKSPQGSGAAPQDAADDPTIELDILEETVSIEGARELRHDAHGLTPAPIPRPWILEGNPVARERRLASSADRPATAFMWDCTAGRFIWLYDAEEIAHLLEGSVVVEDASGLRTALRAGDTFVFAAGSKYQWTIPGYVRKIAFRHSPLSPEMRAVRSAVDRLLAPFRRKPPGSSRDD
ncbi:MAG TPA: cupin domain-containing protein [Acetobacteraceae bacterium]|nr:cupin domain-containing protein [Acetobacteraceae bacterium]